MHYRLIVEYDGTDFHGWQVQPGVRTVQATLEEALARLLGHPAHAAAAGRTDAGVHAAGQVVCFRSERAIPLPTLRRALNALTPEDVVIRAADTVPEEFDARRAARCRRYVYRIWNRREPSPFWRRYAWHVAWALDLDAMRHAAAQLVGEHDFSSFRASGCDATHPVRRVLRSELERRGDLLAYAIEATAFLRHMVRNIVGTLVEVGSGRRDADLTALLAARDRTQAAATAPPHGLCLAEVCYGKTGLAKPDS
jgi:tRNA pseudouridine38-40 synthase